MSALVIGTAAGLMRVKDFLSEGGFDEVHYREGVSRSLDLFGARPDMLVFCREIAGDLGASPILEKALALGIPISLL